MHFPEKTLTIFYCVFFIAMVAWSFALSTTGQTTTQWNYLFNVASAFLFLSGGFVAFSEARKSTIKSSVDHELIFIGVGVTLFGLGLLIWSYYNLALKIESPYPSLSDAVYVLYSPIVAYGLINLLRVSGISLTKRFYLEAIVVFAITAFLIFKLSIPPDLSLELPFLTKLLNVYYLLADALLITLGLMIIRITRGRIHGSFFFFLIALFSMAIADFTFFYRSAQETYYNGDIADIFYALAGTMFTLGIIKIVATQAIMKKYLSTNT